MAVLCYLLTHSLQQPNLTKYQAEIDFKISDLEKRYEELAPKTKVDLVTIGCPQASLEEIERTAELVKGRKIPDNAFMGIYFILKF